jgi:hypothetical protein
VGRPHRRRPQLMGALEDAGGGEDRGERATPKARARLGDAGRRQAGGIFFFWFGS